MEQFKLHPRPPEIPRYAFSPEDDIEDVISSLEDGSEIESVDPQLYPALLVKIPPIISAVQNEDQILAQRLQNIFNFMADRFRNVVSPRRARRLQKQAPKCQLSNADVQTIVSAFNRHEYSPDEEVSAFRKLRAERDAAIDEENYKFAKSIESTMKLLRRNTEEEKTGEQRKARQETLIAKRKECLDYLTDLQVRWKAVFSQYEREREAELKKVQRKLTRTHEKTEKLLLSPPPPSMSRPSPRLLEIRRRERALVMSKRFAEATVVSKDGDTVEAEEAQIQIKQWKKKCEEELAKLEEKQKIQYEIVRMRLEKDKKLMVKTANGEISSAKRKLQYIDRLVSETNASASPRRAGTARSARIIRVTRAPSKS